MKIHFPFHWAHAKECSRGEPGKRALTSSLASRVKGGFPETGIVTVSAAWQMPARNPTDQRVTNRRSKAGAMIKGLWFVPPDVYKRQAMQRAAMVPGGNLAVSLLSLRQSQVAGERDDAVQLLSLIHI